MSCKCKCKCQHLNVGIRITLWCFDNSLEFLERHDPDIFFLYMGMLTVTKIKMLELQKIIFVDLKVGDKNEKGFRLNDSRIVFKQLDGIMNNLCKYSFPMADVWYRLRSHPQWLSYISD